MTSEIISVESLTYQYALAERPALLDINLTVDRGEYLAIVGPCGAGKTTLALSMNGIVPHMMMGEMSGHVLVDGHDTIQGQVREMARTVGMVFDNPEFQLSQSSVLSEMALGLENIGVPREDMLQRIAEALEIVGLSGFEERSPMALSGGQQQRLAIGAALVMYPQVLVLDEPTSNLDPIGKEEVFSVAARLNQEHEMTIVIVEHEVEVIASYADRVIIMDEGSIVSSGSASAVFTDVDNLRRVGVRPPQVTEVVSGLAKRGYSFSTLPVTLEEAETEFSGWEQRKKAASWE